MNSKQFRLAIVGCGRIAAHSHVPSVMRSRRAVLTALVDPLVDRAEALAKRFGVSPIVGSNPSDILGCVDGVIVATPNHIHKDLAIECINAGVPVLIEKPLATTVADGEAILRAAEARQVTVAVGYMTRFRTNVRLMRSLIDSQYLGRPIRFAYQYGSTGGWAPLSGYNLNRQAAGGGVLVVSGSHFLDRMIYWFGNPTEASLQDDSQGGPEANAVAQFRFGDDIHDLQGRARFSKTVDLPEAFVMETTKGTVLLRGGAGSQPVFRPTDAPAFELTIQNGSKADGVPDCDRQLEDFIDACQNRRPPVVSAADGLQSLRLIESLYRHRSAMPNDWYNRQPEQASKMEPIAVARS